ncbi:Sensors of blue-light using FAD [Noviherbaspirillum humi]|uniref:Sensors of blue-light using FAD n=1 Tax=Noviherbaspirillum humi TaxID=1688639 RepID=A0A239C5L7_9BURK|nr:BLUF domain-containing protein [Noviherbaspirillum humi]SNS15565.1 Sensors of blue-light using FAD [Noviherbaspirillum humi]
MLSLTYLSSAVRLMGEAELVNMLKAVRPINEQLGITGLLLYRDGNIIQTLEGPDEAVEATFAKISRDQRHKDVFLLMKQAIDKRQFPNWSMGFHNVSKLSPDALNGFSAFLSDPVAAEAFRDCPEPAYQLLAMFRENMK